ncbi:MAG: HD domain-containing phosphohydrolase [Candidatus Omnitrophota bacterium]
MNNIFLYLVLGIIIGFIPVLILCLKKIKSADKKEDKQKAESPIVNAIAKPAAPAVSNADTMSRLEEKIWQEEETAFIFKLIEKISLSLNNREIAKYIIEEVCKFLNIQHCLLVLLDQGREKIKVKYVIGIKEDQIKDDYFKNGESISGLVIKNNEPLLINNLDNEPWFKTINKEDYLKGAFISVPLSIKNTALGVINVCNKKTGEAFTSEDLSFLINVARVGAIAFQNVELHEQMQDSYLKTMTALAAAIDARDPYTRTHSENVTRYSLLIAKAINYNLVDSETLRRAGLLHDIGKIGIRDEILLKPGKLTEEEFVQIKLHSVKGEGIVKSLVFLREVSCLVRHHHERYDGRGYPDGICGQGIELGARILAVADAFDAMTSNRPYRKRLSLEQAIEELKRNRGLQFDPEITDHFLKILEEQPQIVEDF